MAALRPSLLDRLLDTEPVQAGLQQLQSLARIKQGVARDLEILLNTRRGLAAEQLSPYPLASASVLGFGLEDFVSLTLLSPTDRSNICRAIERCIRDHEPRLRALRVQLEVDHSNRHALRFSIHAVLQLHALSEPVNFNAVLSTMTQQYAVRSEGRGHEQIASPALAHYA